MSQTFTRIVDVALATDGGSVALILERADGSTATLMVDRSFAARGGPDYNRVSLDGEPLSAAESADMLAELVRLTSLLDRLTHPVNKFTKGLRRQKRGT